MPDSPIQNRVTLATINNQLDELESSLLQLYRKSTAVCTFMFDGQLGADDQSKQPEDLKPVEQLRKISEQLSRMSIGMGRISDNITILDDVLVSR
jgi:hypothetical protein